MAGSCRAALAYKQLVQSYRAKDLSQAIERWTELKPINQQDHSNVLLKLRTHD